MMAIFVKQRRFPGTEIRLLRQELESKGNVFFVGLDPDWQPAQPRQELDPDNASRFLKVNLWDRSSQIKQRYFDISQRFPPEQYPQKHVQLRPSYELLYNGIQRLNWFWKSGLISLCLDHGTLKHPFEVFKPENVFKNWENPK